MSALNDSQRATLRRVADLDARGLLFMPRGAGQWARFSMFERLGLVVHAGEAHHEDGGLGQAYRLTDAGRKAVSP